MPTTREQLQSSAKALCDDFANKSPLESLLSHFSTTHQVSAKEHGLQILAPFLGRTFTGRSGLEEYFSLLQKYLTYENMSFGGWVIDAENRKVSVRGQARFKWIEVWADSGAAYLARLGNLNELREAPESKD